YASTLVVWTRREFRGMLSLCQSRGDSEFFSAPDYLWVSSTSGEDVNGFLWPKAKEKQTATTAAAENMLLKRVDDIKWRWKLLILMDGDLPRVVEDVLEKERNWFLKLIEEARQSRRRKSIVGLDVAGDDAVGDDDGGLQSLNVFWETFFAFIRT
ncbi:UNVERIFIED_CONTAM: hypothetical protein HDU68_009525, partial [Siphonaria sp. JEL0065]